MSIITSSSSVSLSALLAAGAFVIGGCGNGSPASAVTAQPATVGVALLSNTDADTWVHLTLLTEATGALEERDVWVSGNASVELELEVDGGEQLIDIESSNDESGAATGTATAGFFVDAGAHVDIAIRLDAILDAVDAPCGERGCDASNEGEGEGDGTDDVATDPGAEGDCGGNCEGDVDSDGDAGIDVNGDGVVDHLDDLDGDGDCDEDDVALYAELDVDVDVGIDVNGDGVVDHDDDLDGDGDCDEDDVALFAELNVDVAVDVGLDVNGDGTVDDEDDLDGDGDCDEDDLDLFLDLGLDVEAGPDANDGSGGVDIGICISLGLGLGITCDDDDVPDDY